MRFTIRALLGAAPLVLVVACSPKSAAPGAPTSATSSEAVATIGSETITLADLDKAAARDLYELRERTLDQMITERIVDKEAKAAGKTRDDYIRGLIEARVPQVSEKEAEDFFNNNKSRLPPQLAAANFADVKNDIVQGLTGQKRKAAIGDLLTELKSKAGVKVMLKAPRVEVAAVGPARGPENAKVTIVEFSDFQCPYCARGREVMERVMKEYDGKVRLVFRDFPLSFHDNAQKAAEAGQCAHEQGKFWPMHDWMFANQGSLAESDLKAAARTLGMDGGKFDTCLGSGKHAQTVSDSMKAGQQAGVSGTPAFVINGTFISGAQPFEKFKAEIDKALAP